MPVTPRLTPSDPVSTLPIAPESDSRLPSTLEINRACPRLFATAMPDCMPTVLSTSINVSNAVVVFLIDATITPDPTTPVTEVPD